VKKNLAVGLFTALSIAMAALPSAAQAPDTVWSHTYHANSSARSLHELPDGGFVLGGEIAPVGESYHDVYIVRTDSQGDTVWTRSVGQPDRSERGISLCLSADGGFVVSGNIAEEAPYTSYSDIYFLKVDDLDK